MTWAIRKLGPEDVTPGLLYELSRRHNLVPESVQSAVANYWSMARNSIVMRVVDDEDSEIATVVVSQIAPEETAEMDLVPVTKRLRRNYKPRLREALGPLWVVLFEELMLRRVSALVPSERVRTITALKALGFQHEGLIRQGVKLQNKAPEDLVLLGLLKDDLS